MDHSHSDFYSREDWLSIAQLAHFTQRFDRMLMAIKKVAILNPDLSSEEKNLFFVAYRKAVDPLRTAIKLLFANGEKNGRHERNFNVYKIQLQGKLSALCIEVNSLIDNQLLKRSNRVQTKIYYMKMKGDYYRYLWEISTEKREVQQKIESSYLAGIQMADKIGKVRVSDPLRLGLILNYCIYLYEIKNDPRQSCQRAKIQLDRSAQGLNQLSHQEMQKTQNIRELIKNNLNLWTSALNEEV